MSLFQDSPQTVGVIGLGIIGSRVAEGLRGAGYHVYVWNRSPKPEPNFLSSAEEVARMAEVIQIFVRDGEALREVVESMAEALTEKHLVINHATVDPASAKVADDLVGARGAAFLNAPFTGSRLAAEKGSLIYYAGGDPQTVERARPLLETSAREVIFVGEVQDAAVLKIATNLIGAATVQALAEAYAITTASGVDPQRLVEALEHHGAGSILTATKLPSIIAGDYEPHFSLDNMMKDAQFAISLGNQLKLDLPALSTTASVMFKSVQKGWGDEDFSVLARHYQSHLPASSGADSGDAETADSA